VARLCQTRLQCSPYPLAGFKGGPTVLSVLVGPLEGIKEEIEGERKGGQEVAEEKRRGRRGRGEEGRGEREKEGKFCSHSSFLWDPQAGRLVPGALRWQKTGLLLPTT